MLKLDHYHVYTNQSHGFDLWEFFWSDGTKETTRDAQHAEEILRHHYTSSPGGYSNAQGHSL